MIEKMKLSLLVHLAITLAASWSCVAQQNPPALQISSPANDTVVNPGQTMSVTVTSPANVAFTQVGVVGEDPIGLSNIATSAPAQFSFTIPADIRCGKYMLTADGSTASGQNAESATILIDVERPDMPNSLYLEPPSPNSRPGNSPGRLRSKFSFPSSRACKTRQQLGSKTGCFSP